MPDSYSLYAPTEASDASPRIPPNPIGVSLSRLGSAMEAILLDPIEASRLIMDTYAAKILVACSRKPKHALELSSKLSIPIAACYRRIHVLEKAGLLKAVDRALTQQGKRIVLYQSMLKNAYIFFEGGKLRVRFQMVTGVTQDFGGEWKEIKLIEEEEEGTPGGLLKPRER